MDQATDYDQGTFPELLYLSAFPDVATAVAAGVLGSGFEHYARFGRAEIQSGQRPSPFSAGGPAAGTAPAPVTDPAEARFSEALYLATNPDVAASVTAGDFPSGFEHWRQFGRLEEEAGLRPSLRSEALYAYPVPPPEPLTATQAAGFDAASYFHLYPDVRVATGGDAGAALEHWLHHGRREGRAGPGVAAHAGWRLRPSVMMAKPFGLDVYGPLAATSGLGTAARGIVRALEAAGLPFVLHPFDVSQGPPRITEPERARPGRYRVNLVLANADQMEPLFALYPPGQFEDAFNVAVWAWELAAFRPDWFGHFAALDEVWTNSAFERDAIAAVAPLPVHVVPLPVEATAVDRAEARRWFGLPPDRFVVLLAFDVGSTAARKNPLDGVRAFREAFPTPGEAFLVVKLHSAELDPSVTAALNAALRGAQDVLLLSERLTSARMAALQCACDCYLSPHRAEGFGLNLAELMALGRPVVATGYSGSNDFLDEHTGFPVPHALVEVERQAGPYMPGYVWAEPSHEGLVRRLREVRDHPDEARARGERGRALMAERFSPAAVGAAIRERLLALGLDAEPPPFLRQLGATRALAVPAPLAGLDEAARAALAGLGGRTPVLSLVVPVHDVPVFMIEACVASVRAQLYPFWELCLCDDASTDPTVGRFLEELRGTDPRIRVRRLARNLGISGASNAAAAMATGEFLLMVDDDDTLSPDALLEVARALVADPLIDALYCDEDKIDEDGTLCDHYHKPDWSPEHLESVMYVLHMLCVRKSLFLRLGGFRDEYTGAQDYDLMLRVSRATTHIHHVPRVLYHWRKRPGSAAATVDAKPRALENGLRALADHAHAKYGADARVEPGLLPGTFRLRRPLRGTPPVTLVVPTANAEADLPGHGRVRLIDNLLASVLGGTDYPDVRVLVADDARMAPEQRAHWEAAGVRVVDYPRGEGPFNYAAKCNWALAQVETRHLVLLNDDMEVLSPGWLTALMELLVDEEIGAVGGRLLHGDGTVQHVGMVIGVNGGAAHLYHSFPGEHVGYNGFTHVIRNYSAVTGACLATRREVLTRVGGLDEGFAVDFNDTDLCLRIREAGWRVAYTPYCELLHFEGRSAPRAAPAEHERLRFASRWRKYMDADPGYNVNLSRSHVDFRLAGVRQGSAFFF